MPDVAFYSSENWEKNKRKRESVPRICPDLVVEVLSKSNSKAEVARKLDEYFRGGTRLGWIVDPKNRSVRVYTSPGTSTIVSETDTLDAGDLLPGFSVTVREFFPDHD
jgi:Uma2 family endonuclease